MYPTEPTLSIPPDVAALGLFPPTLGLAYETLRDSDKRRAYDLLLYPSITRKSPDKPNTHDKKTPNSTTPAPTQEALPDTSRLAALRKAKEEFPTLWAARKQQLESPLFDLRRTIQRLEQEIKNLDSIARAEAAVEARKKSWATWFFYKQSKESEDEIARKDRERQESKIERGLKERRLSSQQAQLEEIEGRLLQAWAEEDAADDRDDESIRAIETRIGAREAAERLAKERLEEERLARIRKQQQDQWEREALEAVKKSEERDERGRVAMLAETKRRAELARQQEEERERRRRACSHGGWWDKVLDRAPCPECYDVWNYLLQCPSCDTKACPKCQRGLRPRFPRNPGNRGPRQRNNDRYDSYNDY